MNNHPLYLTKSAFINKYPKFNDNYEIISEWSNSQELHIIKCKKCNNLWHSRPYNLATNKVKCPFCEGGKTKWDTLYTSEILKDIGFELLTECNSKKDIVSIRHIECGNIISGKLSTLVRIQNNKYHISCPKCRVNSNCEKEISDLLTKLNIEYKREVAFKDLRGLKGGYLRYDFGIYDEYGELKYFIEYDGKQHFEKVTWGVYGEEYYDICHAHDEIKNKYCHEHGYILLRIPYGKRRTVSKIVIEFLKEHKLIPSEADWETNGTCRD